MREETVKVLLQMALWTVPLVLILGAVLAGVLFVVLANWPDL
jgi:uncharacterized integral membrane protein